MVTSSTARCHEIRIADSVPSEASWSVILGPLLKARVALGEYVPSVMNVSVTLLHTVAKNPEKK